MRVLIISPQFAPNNTADSHRVRLILPYLSYFGCEVEVLAVDPLDVRGPIDPWLEKRLPKSVPIHRVRAWPLRGWGLNGLAQRAGIPLYWEGCRLLEKGGFDLVFFSTTRFQLHVLGPLWERRFGVPFCMDYQDPWVNDYYGNHPDIVPPGGRLKYALNDWLHRRGERYVVPRCSGFLAVSAAYLETLTARYGQSVVGQPRLVQPFPGEPAEFAHLDSASPDPRHAGGGRRIIRYVGRGGPDMATSARAFFQAWRALLDCGALAPDDLRFEAIGTAYYADWASTPTLAPLANEFGLEAFVREKPRRLGYHEMLETLHGSDALVALGSDDPAYTASKIYPYLLASRPLLAIFHQKSSVVSLLKEVGGGRCAVFGDDVDEECTVEGIRQFLVDLVQERGDTPLDTAKFHRFSAEAQTQTLVTWFSDVLARSGWRAV